MAKAIKVGIIGGGSWGTALANVLAKNGVFPIIWSRNQQVVDNVNNQHVNEIYFPGIKLNPSITATSNFNELEDCQYLFMVIPVQKIREFCLEHKIASNVPIIICSKGIEIETMQFPSQIIDNISGNQTLILSGPNFASEIIQGLPTASLLAATNQKLIKEVANLINQKNFRIYLSSDKIGVEACGAIKNVIAIATGISTGKKLGENARAALITQGINEIGNLIRVLKGDLSTLHTLAGIGDIILTCSSALSRNMTYGINIAENKNVQNQTVEGVFTTKAIENLAAKLKIELPLCNAIYKILYLSYDVSKVIDELLNRPSYEIL